MRFRVFFSALLLGVYAFSFGQKELEYQQKSLAALPPIWYVETQRCVTVGDAISKAKDPFTKLSRTLPGSGASATVPLNWPTANSYRELQCTVKGARHKTEQSLGLYASLRTTGSFDGVNHYILREGTRTRYPNGLLSDRTIFQTKADHLPEIPGITNAFSTRGVQTYGLQFSGNVASKEFGTLAVIASSNHLIELAPERDWMTVHRRDRNREFWVLACQKFEGHWVPTKTREVLPKTNLIVETTFSHIRKAFTSETDFSPAHKPDTVVHREMEMFYVDKSGKLIPFLTPKRQPANPADRQSLVFMFGGVLLVILVGTFIAFSRPVKSKN